MSEQSFICRHETAGFNPESAQIGEGVAHSYTVIILFIFCRVCASAAAESERGESLHRECGQKAGHHGHADQVRSKLLTFTNSWL